MIQTSQLGTVIAYLPFPGYTSGTTISAFSIFSLTFYTSTSNTFVASYLLNNNYVFAFVSYPRTFSVYYPASSTPYQVNYRNENLFDGKAYAILSNYLVTYDFVNPISTLLKGFQLFSGNQYVFYLDGDILIAQTTPTSFLVYSTKYDKVYTFQYPTSISLGIVYFASATILGNTIYLALFTADSSFIETSAVLLYVNFNYTDGFFVPVPNMTIKTSLLLLFGITPSTTTSANQVAIFGVSVKSHINYVTLIMWIYSSYGSVRSYIFTLTLNLTNGQITSNNYTSGTASLIQLNSVEYIAPSSTLGFNIYYVESVDPFVSVFGNYLIFVSEAPALTTSSQLGLDVITLNVNTSSFDETQFTQPIYSSSMPRYVTVIGNVIYVTIQQLNVVSYGNTYYIPIVLQLIQVTTADMIQVNLTEFSLDHNTVIFSGSVVYAQTGQPIPNAYVYLYTVTSVNGSQISLDTLLAKVQSDANGNFTLSAQLPYSPPDLDVALVVGVDPVILVPVTFPISTQLASSYYY